MPIEKHNFFENMNKAFCEQKISKASLSARAGDQAKRRNLLPIVKKTVLSDMGKLNNELSIINSALLVKRL